MENLFEVIDAGNGHIVKAWKKGVPFEEAAIDQLKRTAQMPFVFKHVAAMPDCHLGVGATIGTVLPTKGACIPAAVGVDLGCGMIAQRYTFTRKELEAVGLAKVRAAIEHAVPCGRTNNGGPGDRGAWTDVPLKVASVWDREFMVPYNELCSKHPGMRARNTYNQLGTLGTGNHFIELSEDEQGRVWLVLHSGSRGLGNKIGTYFTDLAKKLCKEWFIELPDPDLAYLPVSCFDNEYKLNREDEDFPKGEIAMAHLYSDDGFDDFIEEDEEIYEDYDYDGNEDVFDDDMFDEPMDDYRDF